jgi:hypothetical protein
MRDILFSACTALCLIAMPFSTHAGSFNAQGQFIGSVSPVVVATIAQFPAGGPGLRAAIALLLETNPTLADDVVLATRGLTTAQRDAIGAGIADAARFFAICSATSTDTCRVAEALLRQALLFADSVTLAAVEQTAGSDLAGNFAFPPNLFIPGIGGGTCTSQASISCPT